MLLPLTLFAQLTAAQDSTYSSSALRTLVTQATVANRAPAAEFRGYRARVESELSLLLRDSLGRERASQLEQFASSIVWVRGGTYEMHVLGYRTQSLGSPFSTLTFVRGWTEPSLYGDRLRLGVQLPVDSARRRDSTRTDTIVAVHPFAADRERYYRYSGGDTLAVLRSAGRAITVVRVRVTPHLRDSTRLSAFDGEIDLDAERQQIVRMRGTFVILGPRRPNRSMLARMPGLVGVAYCEFINTEVNGKYWLPASQRTELQSTFALLGQSRAIMRIMSTFSSYTIDETSPAVLAVADSRPIPRQLTWAPSDSVSRFNAWRAELGEVTSSVSAGDFADFDPDVWKTTGSPRLELLPTRIGNVVRYNRVEGLYTGVEANVRMRSAAPGLTLGALAGVAWAERTLRGGVHAALRRGPWTFGARGERMLATTNDFIHPHASQSGGLAAILGSIDDFDYVDRRVALGSATRILGDIDDAIVTLQVGVGDDRVERARLVNGFLGRGSFRPNRGAADWTYALGVLDVELHPSLSGLFVQEGVGANLHYEIGRGGLAWQRAELSVSGRQYWGPVAFSAEARGGTVLGARIPPQTLFELGGSGALPGYAYKEFVGDRAALFRGFASYTFPVWRTPHRVRGNYFIPGLAPGFGVGLQGGWTEISSDAARAAVLGLGAVARATNGIRATAGFGVTLFSGSAHIGVARPVDRQAEWKFVVGFGPAF